ncbi:extracellular solute-binding protein [Ruania suaedae]|uniref:extracellular solute-binding protein n=1 Tax=Ruania suaedae TaxID=2897774 RepID=UPI001E39BA86|nr:extracellular solute-binding protein [Ruania suaedae]UFU02883.1 extracellular solute-binding protein [Ruania suaedae]
MTHPIRRRDLLLAGLGGALAAPALAGCAGFTGTASRGEGIRFWNLFSGGDGVLLDGIVQDIEEEIGPVRSTVLEWGQPYYTKLAMASKGGRGPDLAILHLSRLPGYAPGGLLEPFDLDLLAELGIRPEDFDPGLWSRGAVGEDQLAIPMDTHPFITFYDRELADAAGLLTSEGVLREFSSAEDFLDGLDELGETSGMTPLTFGHINHDSQAWRIFWSLFAQTGAEFELSESGAEIDIDGVEQVMELLGAMFDDGRAEPNLQTNAAKSEFTNGRAAMTFSGEWELATFRDVVPNLGASPFPTILGEPAGASDSHAFVLPTQLAADPVLRRQAHEFVAAFLQGSLDWAQAGHIPAYRPVTETEAYAELDPQRDYVSAGEIAALDPQAWFTGSGSEFQRQAGFSIQNAILGQDPAQAAQDLVAYVEEKAAEPDPTRGTTS